MKIRTDFVTNSSSSSFLVAFIPPPEVDKETLDRYPALQGYLEIVNAIFDSDSIFNTGKEIELYMKDNRDDEFEIEDWYKYDEIVKYEDSGCKFGIITVAGEGSPGVEYIHKLAGKSKIIRIIDDDF